MKSRNHTLSTLSLIWVWLALLGCASTGDYALSSVPDVTVVGGKIYMDWFEDHAVTDATRRFVAAHEPALDAALCTVERLTARRLDCAVKTRRDPNRNRPALKEPHKVEEKIYRMILESEARWLAHGDGRGKPGCLPRGVSPKEARHLILTADPRDPCALRDIAGIRIVVPSMAQLRELDEAMRAAYTTRVIRYKDFVGKQYRGDGYRSIHFVVLEENLPVEIQLRTRRQQRWAKWEHRLIYKGRFKHNKDALDYARKVADRLHRQDTDSCPKPCPLPECPAILDEAGACYQD